MSLPRPTNECVLLNHASLGQTTVVVVPNLHAGLLFGNRVSGTTRETKTRRVFFFSFCYHTHHTSHITFIFNHTLQTFPVVRCPLCVRLHHPLARTCVCVCLAKSLAVVYFISGKLTQACCTPLHLKAKSNYCY